MAVSESPIQSPGQSSWRSSERLDEGFALPADQPDDALIRLIARAFDARAQLFPGRSSCYLQQRDLPTSAAIRQKFLAVEPSGLMPINDKST